MNLYYKKNVRKNVHYTLTQTNIHTLFSRVPCGLLAIFGRNAFGLRSKVASTASLLEASFSTLL